MNSVNIMPLFIFDALTSFGKILMCYQEPENLPKIPDKWDPF